MALCYGRLLGYFPEPSKSCVVVSEKFTSEAENIFSEFGIKVVHNKTVLGVIIGNEAGRSSYIEQLVNK